MYFVNRQLCTHNMASAGSDMPLCLHIIRLWRAQSTKCSTINPVCICSFTPSPCTILFNHILRHIGSCNCLQYIAPIKCSLLICINTNRLLLWRINLRSWMQLLLHLWNNSTKAPCNWFFLFADRHVSHSIICLLRFDICHCVNTFTRFCNKHRVPVC